MSQFFGIMFMPEDNIWVMDRDKNKAPELRQVIAVTVASNQMKYSEAVLGKTNQEYCERILNCKNWGGAIELSILGSEIAVYDIQTVRCDLYGQMSPSEGASEEFDQTAFAVQNSRSIGPVEGQALSLVLEQKRLRNYYTDTAPNFGLRCGVCQIGLVSNKDASEHAQATGHTDFEEYKAYTHRDIGELCFKIFKL